MPSSYMIVIYALLIGASRQVHGQVSLPVNSLMAAQTYSNSSFKQFEVDFSSVELPVVLSVVASEIAPGRVDVFVTDDGKEATSSNAHWRASSLFATVERLVLYVADPDTRIRVGVQGTQGRVTGPGPGVVDFNLGASTTPLEVQEVAAPEGTARGALEAPWVDLFHTTVPNPDKFHMVHLVLETAKPAGASAFTQRFEVRVASTLETAMNIAPEARSFFFPPADTYLNSFDKTAKVMQATQGQTTLTYGYLSSNIAYMWGGKELFLSMHNINEAIMTDPLISSPLPEPVRYNLTIRQEEVIPNCFGDSYTDNLSKDRPVDLRGQSWMFFQMDLPDEGFFQSALIGVPTADDLFVDLNNDLDMFISTSNPFPMSDADGFFSFKTCTTVNCVETFAIPETRGNLSHPDPCGSITPQLYVGIRSNALVTQISRFVALFVPLSKRCGWRPSYALCQAGGSVDFALYGNGAARCTPCTGNVLQLAKFCAADTDQFAIDHCNVLPGDSEACSSYSTACACVADRKCGWCGREVEKGACAPRNARGDGPTMGACDIFLTRENPVVNGISCESSCSIHNSARAGMVCEACTDDPTCGMCIGSNGFACINGNLAAPAAGSCEETSVGPTPAGFPTNRTYFPSIDTCGFVKGIAPATQVAPGRAVPGVVFPQGGLCGIGICDRKYYEFVVPQLITDSDATALDVQVTVTFPTETPRDVYVLAFKQLPRDIETQTVLMDGPMRALPPYSERAVETFRGDGVTRYTLLTSICDRTAFSSFYVGVYKVPPVFEILESERPEEEDDAAADAGGVGSLFARMPFSMELTVLNGTVRVPTDPKLKITEVVTSPKYLCCGAVRHFQLQIDMPEDELAHQRSLDVQVVAEAGSQTLATTNATMTVYGRYGACSSAISHTKQASQLLPAGPLTLANLESMGNQAWWHIAVGSGLQGSNFSLRIVHTDNGPITRENDVQQAAIVGSVLAVFLVFVIAGVMYYDYTHNRSFFKSRTKQDSLVALEEGSKEETTPINVELPDDYLETQGLVSGDLTPTDSGRALVGRITPPEPSLTKRDSLIRAQQVLVDRSVVEARTTPDMNALLAMVRESTVSVSSPASGSKIGTAATGIPAAPPMPPMPPPGGPTRPRSKMTAFGAMERDPFVVAEFQRLRREDMGEDELEKDQKHLKPEGSGGTVIKKGEMLDELRGKSSYHAQLKMEVEKYGPMLLQLGEEIESYKPKTMEKLVKFLPKVESALDALTNERDVLKNVPSWPEKRMDVLREAVSLYTEITSIHTLLKDWEVDIIPDDTFYTKSLEVYSRTTRRLDQIKNEYDRNLQKFEAQQLPWDKHILENALHATMKFFQTFALRSLQDVAKLRSNPQFTVEMDQRVSKILDDGVKVGFRVHQFNSGFTKTCSLLFTEVAKLRAEQVETAKLASGSGSAPRISPAASPRGKETSNFARSSSIPE